jgi:hypothetical protein
MLRIAPLSSKRTTASPNKKYVSELIILAAPSSYPRQGVVWCVATEGGTHHVRLLEDRFAPEPNHGQRRDLENKRQEVATLLDKQGKKKLLRLVDTHTMVQEEIALASFIAGFRLVWGIAMELGADGSYSYEREQEEINRHKNYRGGEVCG